MGSKDIREIDNEVDLRVPISAETVDRSSQKMVEDLVKQTKDKVETVQKGSSLRLRAFLKLWKIAMIKGEIVTEGKENLEQIPEGGKAIFACSHISDGDVPVAANAFCNKYDLAIVNQSTHHSWKEEPAMKVSLLAAGHKNFFPIDFSFDKKASGYKKRGSFNPENYFPMRDALEENHKTLLIAAHSPSFGTMPEKGGIGVVYLSQITGDAVVVPIASVLGTSADAAVDMGTPVKSLMTRPSAKVIVGKPIRFEKILGIENLADLIAKESPTESDRAEIDRMKAELRKQSDILMGEIAKLMPDGKRGKW